MKSFKKYVAEFIGTALLTLIGCGVAVVTNAAIGNSTSIWVSDSGPCLLTR